MARKLIQLREERNRLLVLAKKKRKVRIQQERLKREQIKLKKEISMLKAETSKQITKRIIKAATSPKTKAKLKKAKSVFLKYAERLGDADI